MKVEKLLPETFKTANTPEKFFSMLKEEDARFEKLRADAAKKGKRLRYIARLEKGKASVGLEAVGEEHPFYNLSGSDNIIAFTTERYKVTPLGYALRSTEPAVRMLAARELGRIKDRRTLRALVHRTERDADPEVRAACFDAAKAFGDPELIAPFVRTLLNNPEPEPRAAAAEAIGRSGDLRGIQYLVYAIEAHGGGPRAHIYGANQLTFVQDFDVEVAQTAFIADPQVGLIQDGFALDVKVVSSELYQTRVERHAIVGALKRLSGADLGDDAAAWRNWARENREKLVASAK